ARNAILVFDGDPGGRVALLRCLKVSRHNLIVKAVILPEGDPDEIVREGKTAEFEAFIEKAKTLREAAIEIIGQRKEKDSVEHLTEEVARLADRESKHRSSLRPQESCRSKFSVV